MVRGINAFRKHFKGFENQYILIGGVACDILFSKNNSQFRATRDFDMVLIVEALTPEFGKKFWEFVETGQYRNKATSVGKSQFYRFDKPVHDEYPKMLELFSRNDWSLKSTTGLTKIHIDDQVSSLSAILLNDEYYHALLAGRVVIHDLCVLRPEYLILFKAKAYLDLRERKENGEAIDSRDIKKHKNDILRILAEFVLEQVNDLPATVKCDIDVFIQELQNEPFDENMLKALGLSGEEMVDKLIELYK